MGRSSRRLATLDGLPTPSPSATSLSAGSEHSSPVPLRQSRKRSRTDNDNSSQAIPRRSKRIRARLPDVRCHIDKLPPELLIMIFLEVQKSLKTQKYTLEPSVRTVVSIAHVCRRWRSLMIHCPPHMVRSLSLYSVFDDRKDNTELEVPEIHSSTIRPEALADFLEEYRVRELASFVFAGQSNAIFDFNLKQRNKRRRKLAVKRLWFLGLNHLSAELLLTNDFSNLQYLSFMYTNVNHITQICNIIRRPIQCEILSLDGVGVRKDRSNLIYWEDPRDTCVLLALDVIRVWIHFKHLRVNATSLLGGAKPTTYAKSRQICQASHKDHVREFATVLNVPPRLETLGVWEFKATQLCQMSLDLSQLRQISIEISDFDIHDPDCGKWKETFWCDLLQAGPKLEKVAISGMRRERDLLDLAQALGKLGPDCKVAFSGSIPDEVIQALKRQKPQVEFVSSGRASDAVPSEKGKWAKKSLDT